MELNLCARVCFRIPTRSGTSLLAPLKDAFSPQFSPPPGVIWTNVLLMDEVLPDVALSDFSLEELAASFSGGGVRGYEYGLAFVPAEICRIFLSAGEKFLHLALVINWRASWVGMI